MIWAILAIPGVPLWICALAILILMLRNGALRCRVGDVPVRVLRPGKRRWTRVATDRQHRAGLLGPFAAAPDWSSGATS